MDTNTGIFKLRSQIRELKYIRKNVENIQQKSQLILDILTKEEELNSKTTDNLKKFIPLLHLELVSNVDRVEDLVTPQDNIYIFLNKKYITPLSLTQKEDECDLLPKNYVRKNIHQQISYYRYIFNPVWESLEKNSKDLYLFHIPGLIKVFKDGVSIVNDALMQNRESFSNQLEYLSYIWSLAKKIDKRSLFSSYIFTFLNYSLATIADSGDRENGYEEMFPSMLILYPS